MLDHNYAQARNDRNREDATTIIRALSTAFGGRSQYGAREVAGALFGRVRNCGWERERALTVLEDILRLETEYWDYAPREVVAWRALALATFTSR